MKLNGFILTKFTISNNKITRDIRNVFLSCEIVESIFSPFLFGELYILDTIGITENFPIIGNEIIDLQYQVEHSKKTIECFMKIYKYENIDDAQKTEKKHRIIKLYVCSLPAVLNKLKRISRSFSGTGNDIINTLMTSLSSTKNIDHQTVTNPIKFISNFWTCAGCIKYVCEHCIEDKYTDFTFFETMKKFNFKSISYLLEQPEFDKISFDETFKLLTSYSKIKYFNQSSFFDLLNLANQGFFGKTYYQIHPTEYSYKKQTQILTDAQNLYTTLGNGNQFDVELDSITTKIEHTFKNIDIESVRNFSITAMKNYNTEINMNGDIDREVGNNYNINYKTFDNESESSEFYNGKWFLHTMKHIFTINGEYEQNMLLTKNAFLNTNNKVTRLTGNVSR